MKKRNYLSRQDDTETRNLALNYSLKYLSFRNRSTKEIKNYLNKKGFVEATVETTVQKLNELKFLNDEKFASDWIESRQRNKGKSKFLLRQELKIKGVSDESIGQALNDAQDDLETARALFEKKKRLYAGLPKLEFQRKMGGFLQRKGYSWEVIKKLFDGS